MSDLRKVWIKSFAENLEIVLPITPFPKFKESMSTNVQELFGFGEIDSGSNVKLDTWTCESFFPDGNNNYSFDVSYIKYAPEYYVEVLSRWMKQEQVLEFQYYTASKTLNAYYCKIVGFDHEERNGSKNVYYTLYFREHKELNVEYQGSVNSAAISASYGSDTYYVAEGDTLITIAAKIYGDSTKWSYLMNNNNLKNPLDITAGQSLKL
ncbi:LysM peptidoglycan-binding domain-containing protein [Clostridium beijerinckii]|uniref:LysM peptidoglycan-binding domain-containing protein n=1 Tax=Clostridium beijerinckii TaxID=1520 RepID=UPI00232BCB5C|nr:LysM domain-containing protein [Clostridium beijerinckii]